MRLSFRGQLEPGFPLPRNCWLRGSVANAGKTLKMQQTLSPAQPPSGRQVVNDLAMVREKPSLAARALARKAGNEFLHSASGVCVHCFLVIAFPSYFHFHFHVTTI